MNILKAFAIAFSLYSKIPMPQFEWKDRDMKYSFIFFPWVGILIGGLELGWFFLGSYMKIPDLANTLIALAIPIIITGGFHVDGFMDVSDGLHSYAPREKKLEILKDPHIGAFSVISLAAAGLIYAAAINTIFEENDLFLIILWTISFVLSRTISALGVLFLRKAKKEGMVKDESEGVGHGVSICLHITLLVCSLAAIYIYPMGGLLVLATQALCFMYYRWKSYKEFGGITGDTAGFFLVISEIAMAVAVAVAGVLM